MFQIIESYNKQKSFSSCVESFWTVITNEHVDTIKNLNGHNKAASITCFDFSTSYPNISHGKLIRFLNEHTGFCFKGGEGKLIVVNRYGPQGGTGKKQDRYYLLKAL